MDEREADEHEHARAETCSELKKAFNTVKVRFFLCWFLQRVFSRFLTAFADFFVGVFM